MSPPAILDLLGVWRRSVIVRADGSRDECDGVIWVQGPTWYVDVRGFAGRLVREQDWFRWQHDIDLTGETEPDAGWLAWDGDDLIETGRYDPYRETWQRSSLASECSDTLLRHRRDGDLAVLVRAGSTMAFACGGGKPRVRLTDDGTWPDEASAEADWRAVDG